MRFDRLNALLEVLSDEKRQVSVEELATRLDVSGATVRRDLDHLAGQQLLTRVRGGAIANAAADLPMRYKTARRSTEKERIGRLAAQLIVPGMSVGMNGGTTTTEVARWLAQRSDLMGATNDQRVTVVTNALNIASELAVRPHVKVTVTGGVARPQSYELIGPLANHVLEQVALDMVFLGVDGLDPTEGATTPDEGEASVNRLLVSRAKTVVAVADGSKLGKSTFARICASTQLDVLVTDEHAPSDVLSEFEKLGIEVQRA